ncbi:MAG: putative metal-dependent protease of the PAD1/JAB1 superfamily [uncultured archaeon A07HB70]|nr:MAG: putative metal-dependent protease of the PAD1/JAB1 superfamily [uncultured archaeon A07HB70]
MITLARTAYDAVVSHARDGGDEEVCGVLAGTYGDQESRVETAHRARNVAERPTVRYRIDPEEQLAILESVADAGRTAVGFYHSHPAGPPGPSETDAARAAWPDRSYVVCALDGQPFVGSWRWRDDGERFEAETVAVE